MMTPPILIVDDESAIRRLVRGAIERAGMHCAEANTAAEALTSACRTGCQVVLLDLGLPDRDGMELVPLIKAMDRAVIVLTARGATDEKVAALDLGADDYITKPFDTEELLARIRVAIRNRAGTGSNNKFDFGTVSIDIGAHLVIKDGQEVHLTPKEFALLGELARYGGKVVTHKHLLRTIWGETHIEDIEYLRVTMRSLRAKIEDNPATPTLLINDPGIGYRIVIPASGTTNLDHTV